MICNQSHLKYQAKENLKQKYNYLSDADVDAIYDVALADYVFLRYPSENSRPKVENVKIDFFVSQWIYKRMDDIVQREGISSLTSYSENGLKYSFAGTDIDPQLVSQIMPKAGIPR